MTAILIWCVLFLSIVIVLWFKRSLSKRIEHMERRLGILLACVKMLKDASVIVAERSRENEENIAAHRTEYCKHLREQHRMYP